MSTQTEVRTFDILHSNYDKARSMPFLESNIGQALMALATLSDDPLLDELNQEVLELSYELENFIPGEFNSYVAHNKIAGYNIHLLDEEHLPVISIEGVMPSEVSESFRILALRYYLFASENPVTADGYVFDDENEEWDNAQLYEFFSSLPNGDATTGVHAKFEDWANR